jgi:hypothetical protein
MLAKEILPPALSLEGAWGQSDPSTIYIFVSGGSSSLPLIAARCEFAVTGVSPPYGTVDVMNLGPLSR